jgi:hypothetical protein
MNIYNSTGENMFAIESVETIKEELIKGKTQKINFPKSVIFNFSELYKDIVTKIKTMEISSECILYNSVESYNVTKEFSNKDYWKKNISDEEIQNYWIIGQNGQGDLWLMDINDRIYFYNHDLEEMCKENFTELDIDFGEWLQYAYLNRELDKIINDNQYNEKIGKEYMEKIKDVNKILFENYPFRIE